MEPSVPPQLPADVLERIFSIGQPRSQSKDPVLSDRERVRPGAAAERPRSVRAAPLLAAVASALPLHGAAAAA